MLSSRFSACFKAYPPPHLLLGQVNGTLLSIIEAGGWSMGLLLRGVDGDFPESCSGGSDLGRPWPTFSGGCAADINMLILGTYPEAALNGTIRNQNQN